MATVFETISDLSEIITDTITAGNSNNTPGRAIRKTLIKVTTGQYREVLPIIVPAECCIMGDELRSVNTQPRTASNSSLTDRDDFRYTKQAIERLEAIVGDVAGGVAVTPTTGNTTTQTRAYPFAETDAVKNGFIQQARAIHQKIDNNLGGKLNGELPKWYSMSSQETGKGRDLMLANKEFLKAETTAWIADEYPNLYYSKTKCKQDVGYIIDAVAYDMTFGGNWQSYTAGSAYYDGALNINAGNELVTNGDFSATTDWTISNSSAWAIQNNQLEFIGTDSDVGTVSQTINTEPKQEYTINFDANNFVANNVTVYATNEGSTDKLEIATTISAGGAGTYTFTAEKIKTVIYFEKSGTTGQGTDIDNVSITSPQKIATIAAYNHLKGLMQTVQRSIAVTPLSQTDVAQKTGDGGTAGVSTTIGNLMDDIVDIIETGTSAVTRTYPSLSGVDADLFSDTQDIDNAKDQVAEYTIDFINRNFGSFQYDSGTCRRDLTRIFEAVQNDVLTGSNYLAIQTGRRYQNSYVAYFLNNQKTQTVGAIRHARDEIIDDLTDTTYITRTRNAFNEIIDIINNGASAADTLSFPSYNSSQNAQDAKDNLQANIDFMKADVTAYIANNYPLLDYDQAKCERDVGYIIDGVCFDVMYGGNIAAVRLAESYFDDDGNILVSSQETETVAAYGHLSTIAQQIAQEQSVTAQSGNTELQTTLGTPASATEATLINNVITEITDAITAGNTNGIASVTEVTSTETGQTATDYALFDSEYDAIEKSTLQYVTDTYSDFKYNHTKCTRDLGLIFDAVKYDLLLGGNWASLITALSYNRRSSNKVIGDQKVATIAANDFALQQMKAVLVGEEAGTTAQLNETFQLVNDTIYQASSEGANLQVADQEVYNGIYQLETNKDFIADECVAYVEDYFKQTVTALTASVNAITVADATKYWICMPIKFTSLDDSTTLDEVDEITEGNTYYVRQILSAHRFTISATPGGAEVAINADNSLQFFVDKTYTYNTTLCKRDIKEYIYAMKHDIMYSGTWGVNYRSPRVAHDTSGIFMNRPGWYRTNLAQRYYTNSIIGSQEEDMYYLRNGTGLRLQTLDGLRGDLGPMNVYGTRRPTAGAYASLDPGWGPKDERVWITARSPYVQNVSTFGYAATGQKIDGSLHDGGNDSIVSNDFTQVISDGIGAWLLNNGRAELVSVFTYYSHIGYLCETGGRARATNGNNSYGTYGSVAEGVDPDETAVTAVVDNISQYNATIGNVFTNTDELQRMEFDHAGNDYTEAVFDIFGAGDDEELVADEFRDNAIARVPVGEVTDGDAGGSGYTVAGNTAQAGSLTGITLAATDGSLSSAYIGMVVYVTGGAGVGNYGFIQTYNSGSKAATVNDRYGNAGWSHVVPGTTIVAPNSSSTYQVEPAVTFTAPTASVQTGTTALGSVTVNNIGYVETAGTYTNVASESNADGSGATFDVTRNGSKYYVSINATGTDFKRLDTVTIKGNNLGGRADDNDITVTITTVNATGGVVDFDISGKGEAGSFVVLNNGTLLHHPDMSAAPTSYTLTGNHTSIAYGLQDDGSSTATPHAIVIARNGSDTIAYQSGNDDLSQGWATVSTGLGTTGDHRVAYGSLGAGVNKFVVVPSNSRNVAGSTDGGQSWTVTSNALPATVVGSNAVTYGKGLYVAIGSGTDKGATSADGVTWTEVTLPNSKTWIDVKWGNGIFVALASDTGANNMAYSIDGTNWVAASTPDATATPSGLAYGQGVWVATYSSTETEYAWSYDGVEWDETTGLTDIGEKVAFGNPVEVGETTIRGRFVTVEDTSNTAKAIYRGAQALGRAGIANEKIFVVRMCEPGSDYQSAPTITVTDPGNIDDVVLTTTITEGALANPTYINRGNGFITASAEINDTNSNGGADFVQSGKFVAVKRLSKRPVAGSNVIFDSLPDQVFKLVNTVSLRGTNDGSYTGFLQISPDMTVNDAPADGDPVTMRIRFSQVRLTGHDFLDIGTGNFTDTNYPGTPVNAPDQANETKDDNGGRVFFTATDQDGNFRVGDLFSIEQATGVATLNAEAFNIAGLQELTLGEVTLGGNSASVTEFSTDPFFTANSDSVVPTQRAVKAYIEAQIGGGGATLNVNSVTAGDIFVNTNQITTVSGEQINIRANVNFQRSVVGLPLAYNYFLR